MKHGWCRLASVVMIFLALCLTQAMADTQPDGTYVRVVRDSVNLRRDASVQSESWLQLKKGYTCQLLSVESVSADRWYCVLAGKPGSTIGYVGYIRSDMAELMTSGAAAAWEQSPVQPDGQSGVAGARALASVSGTAWLYQNPQRTASVCLMQDGDGVQVLRRTVDADGEELYLVAYGNQVGYAAASDMRITCGSAEQVPAEADIWYTTAGRVNLRSQPRRSAGNVLANIARPATAVEVFARVLTRDDEWYLAAYGSQLGYVHGDMLSKRADDALEISGCAETLEDDIRVRTQPRGMVLTTTGKAGARLVFDDMLTEGSDSWYHVSCAQGSSGWVYGGLVKEIPLSEADPGMAQTEPEAVSETGYVRTTVERLLLRAVPGGVAVDRIEEKGLVLPYDRVSTLQGSSWYHVTLPLGKSGWVSGRFAEPLSDEMMEKLRLTRPEAAAEEAEPVASALAPAREAAQDNGYGLLTAPALVRSAPGGMVVETVTGDGSALPYHAATMWEGDMWYLVAYAPDRQGWVRGGSFCPSSMVAISAVPTPFVTEQPPVNDIPLGLVMTTNPYVYVRATPGGTAVGQVERADTQMPCYAVESYRGETWYQVEYAAGKRGWMHSGYVRWVNEETATPQPTMTVSPTPSPAPTAVRRTGYVKTTTARLQVRDVPFGDQVVGRIEQAETIVPFTDVSYETYVNWYRVEYAPGAFGWVHGAYVIEVDEDEAATPPADAPTHGPWLGQVRTTGSNVQVRSQPGNGEVLARIPEALTVLSFDSVRTLDGTRWYRVAYAEQGYGWISGAYAEAMADDSIAVPHITSHEPQQIVTLNDDIAVTWTQVPEAALYAVSTQVLEGEPAFAPTERGEALVEGMTTTANGVLLVRSQLAQYAGRWLKLSVTAVTGEGSASQEAVVYLHLDAVERARFTSHEDGDTIDLAMNPVIAWTTDGGYAWYHVSMSLLAGEPGQDDEDAQLLMDRELVNSQSLLLDRSVLESGRWLRITVETYDEARGNAEASVLCLLLTDSAPVPTQAPTDTPPVEDATENGSEPEAEGGDASKPADEPDASEPADEPEEPAGDDAPAEEAPADEPMMVGGMPVYPAEKVDWFTGDIQQLLPRGSVFQVYDVASGIVWTAKRSAGGNHADIEPLTEADSAKFLTMYAVSDLSEIREDNHWQRRACLVTVGERTFACSLYGVPHNPDGDTLPDNGMDGQVCLHFTNSLSHSAASQTQDQYHREAIEQAWLNAPNGRR
ncbi:MAG: hypothetical protein Q4E72_07750 [bacterium]|nr:hypothetical protein [bacterium]